MLSVDIEKEIQQENRIILGLTMRQLICLGAAGLISILLVLLLGADSDLMMFPMFAVGIGCFFFGWKKYDGLPMEQVLLRKLRTFVYKNDRRVYRTKNAYVSLLNAEYDRLRAIDLSDRKIAKAIRKEDKLKARLRKKSAIKPIKES